MTLWRRFLAYLRRLWHGEPRPVPAPVPAPAPTPVPPPPVPTPAPAPPPPPVVVSPPPTGTGEPVYVPGAHRLLWEDDFAPQDVPLMHRYATMADEQGLSIDRGAGLEGSDALRITWNPRAGCADDSHLIEKSWPDAPRDLVAQWTVRYSPGFVFDWIGRSEGCAGNAKKLFFLWAGGGERFMLICENHRIGVGSDYDHPLFPPNVGPELTPEELGDGRYHRITLRIRQSSTAIAADGAIHGWVDGVKRWELEGIASRATGGWSLFKMPTTFNQGSPVAQTEWVDAIRVWVP